MLNLPKSFYSDRATFPNRGRSKKRHSTGTTSRSG